MIKINRILHKNHGGGSCHRLRKGETAMKSLINTQNQQFFGFTFFGGFYFSRFFPVSETKPVDDISSR